jgi:low affinity Fe/Cu permease
MKKNIMMVAVAAFVTLSFAACNNNANTENTDTTEAIEQLVEEPIAEVNATPDSVATVETETPAPAAKKTTTKKATTQKQQEPRVAIEVNEEKKAADIKVDANTTVTKSDKKIKRAQF